MKTGVIDTALACAIALFGVASSSQASQSRTIEIRSVSSVDGELAVAFRDLAPVQNNCGYYIQRMEYVASINTLLVNLESPEPCLVDRVGKREGQLKWALPFNRRAQGEAQLVVNGQRIGKLKWDHDRAELDDSGSDQ